MRMRLILDSTSSALRTLRAYVWMCVRSKAHPMSACGLIFVFIFLTLCNLLWSIGTLHEHSLIIISAECFKHLTNTSVDWHYANTKHSQTTLCSCGCCCCCCCFLNLKIDLWYVQKKYRWTLRRFWFALKYKFGCKCFNKMFLDSRGIWRIRVDSNLPIGVSKLFGSSKAQPCTDW